MVFFENLYFGCMLITYTIFITFLYHKHAENPSISKTIEQNREPILLMVFVFFIFTILYESHRYRKFSIFASIILLYIGIFGVILINEDNIGHYIFATLVGLSMLIFIFLHCLIKKENSVDRYWLLFYLTIIAIIGCLINMDTNITYWEALFISLFAIFYISLHFQDTI